MLGAMCFSVAADMVAGVALLPVAALSLREVRTRRELPFALLPAVFAVHQLIEAVVWLGVQGQVSARAQSVAALAYLLIALPLLPTLLPLSVLLLEPRGARLRVAPFLALGVLVTAVLGQAVLTGPVRVVAHPHALEYGTAITYGDFWAVLYVAAVIGPALLSGYASIVAFGVVNLVGLVTVALLLSQEFDSVWCVYAALASVLVLVHLRRRRRLPDPHRLRGDPAAGPRRAAGWRGPRVGKDGDPAGVAPA